MKTATCYTCNVTKPIDQFYKKTKSKKGHTPNCAQCSRLRESKLREKPLYTAFAGVKSRVNHSSSDSYHRYGGRGITYDTELFQSYDYFWSVFKDDYNEALAKYPGEKLTIDRIDNDGDYVVGNIRFVPRIINDNNKCDNYYITWHGETKSAATWAVEFNLPAASVRKRHRAGWSYALIKQIPNNSQMVRAITLQLKEVRKQAIAEIKKSIRLIEFPPVELSQRQIHRNKESS